MRTVASTFFLTVLAFQAAAHEHKRPPARDKRHATAIADISALDSRVTIAVHGGRRIVKSNALPDHDVGRFPNPHNPNAIEAQDLTLSMPARPTLARAPTGLGLHLHGVMLNGVPVALWPAGCHVPRRGCTDPATPWRMNAYAHRLGYDEHHAHVQRQGVYHYHKGPQILYEGETPTRDRPAILVGYAADGFPIYGPLVFVDGRTKIVRSSYRIKSGTRRSLKGEAFPEGRYNGEYHEDFQYEDGLGDLDACNGTAEITGSYGYFVTHSNGDGSTDGFPYILNCFAGKPDPSFLREGAGRGRR